MFGSLCLCFGYVDVCYLWIGKDYGGYCGVVVIQVVVV